MGYYTTFKLETDDDQPHVCPTCGSNAVRNHEEILYKRFGCNLFEEATKWYSWEQDMLEYSKEYPDVLFTLEGQGEEAEDRWAAYFKNGKWQFEKAEMQIAAFDLDKLE